jgi:hypothetical protein
VHNPLWIDVDMWVTGAASTIDRASAGERLIYATDGAKTRLGRGA